MVSEIRPINGQLYYCDVDYSTNRRGDIVKVTKRICVPIYNDTQYKIENGKIVSIEKELVEKIKETEKPEIHTTVVDDKKEIDKSDWETGEVKGFSDDSDEIEPESDEIEGLEDNKKEEVDKMVSESELRRQILDEIEQKKRTEKLEQELADTKAYVNSINKTLDTNMGNLGSKIDRLSISTQKPRNDEPVDDILRKIKAKQGLTELIPSKEDVDCPDCVKKDGHHHSLKKTEKGTLKCTGVNCNHEFILLPKAEKYDGVCKTCGASVNRSMDKCANCGGTSARAI